MWSSLHLTPRLLTLPVFLSFCCVYLDFTLLQRQLPGVQQTHAPTGVRACAASPTPYLVYTATALMSGCSTVVVTRTLEGALACVRVYAPVIKAGVKASKLRGEASPDPRAPLYCST